MAGTRPERVIRRVAKAATPAAPATVLMAGQMDTLPKSTRRQATTRATAPAAITTGISMAAPLRSGQEPDLRRQLGGEGGDHREVEEPGGRLDGLGAGPLERGPDEGG